MAISEQEYRQAHKDAKHDDQVMREEEQQAKDKGYCIHCGADIDDCTGYKCWK